MIRKSDFGTDPGMMVGKEKCFDESLALQSRFHRAIPGGSHTYNKGDDQYPEGSPIIIARGQGCRVWDVDGNQFVEYGMGSRSVTLGHAYPRVIRAAAAHLSLGTNYTRPAKIELDYAEALLAHLDGPDQVKFAKDGSAVTSAAVKLARAYTGREMIAVCADHPFFSYNDWFIGSTPMPAGIPGAVRDLSVTFRYNDLASVSRLFEHHPGAIACLIMEPARGEEPRDGFLTKVVDLCHAHGALVILDEMITGFRWHEKGAQHLYDVTPDLSTFGKALANGFSVSALAGRRELMEAGGLTTTGERVFLLSTTHGAETHALAAAMETLRVYQEEPVVEFLYRQGRRLQKEINQQAAVRGLTDYFEVVGHPTSLVYVTRDRDRKPSQPFRTLVLQELINEGILAPSLTVSYAHNDAIINQTVEAFGHVLDVYGKALDDGVGAYLVGRPVRPVMRPFN